MKEFIAHYRKVNLEAIEKLKEFEKHYFSDSDTLIEELAFCIFAANSSAKMGLKAVELLRPVIKSKNPDKIQTALFKKVRFYNIRSKYLIYNLQLIDENHGNIKNLINKFKDKYELRIYLKENIKGFGMKEASHFLRNIGFKGFAIIDKHVINTLNELKVINSKAPKNVKEYLQIENQIVDFAYKMGFNIDVLDLAIWSFKTGEIIK